jgi:hypothetical protein
MSPRQLLDRLARGVELYPRMRRISSRVPDSLRLEQPSRLAEGRLEGPPRIEAGRAWIWEGGILCLSGGPVHPGPFGPQKGELVRRGAGGFWSCRKLWHKFVAS